MLIKTTARSCRTTALIRGSACLRAAIDHRLVELSGIDGLADDDAIMRLVFHEDCIVALCRPYRSPGWSPRNRPRYRRTAWCRWSLECSAAAARFPPAAPAGPYPGRQDRRVGGRGRLPCRAVPRAAASREHGQDNEGCMLSHGDLWQDRRCVRTAWLIHNSLSLSPVSWADWARPAQGWGT